MVDHRDMHWTAADAPLLTKMALLFVAALSIFPLLQWYLEHLTGTQLDRWISAIIDAAVTP